jgi:nicotinamide riboside kinase
MGILPPSIYVIGAQCTGKTTLVTALHSHIIQHQVAPHNRLHKITEVAREVLRDHQFTRADLDRPDRAMQLQYLILEAQLKAENHDHPEGMILSDRSGLDPLVYAAKYGPPGQLASIMASPSWEILKSRMQGSLVILCPPRADWLFDDGTRLMESWDDWEYTHQLFQKLLADNNIPYHIIPGSASSTLERVEFVLSLWHRDFSTLTTRSTTATSSQILDVDSSCPRINKL